MWLLMRLLLRRLDWGKGMGCDGEACDRICLFLTVNPDLKQDMWSQIAEEMGIPWCAVEAMHWQMGQHEMARLARVIPLTLAKPEPQQVPSYADLIANMLEQKHLPLRQNSNTSFLC